jgi:hypothetical protein
LVLEGFMAQVFQAMLLAATTSYPVGEVAKAIKYPLDGHARGKVVITVASLDASHAL